MKKQELTKYYQNPKFLRHFTYKLILLSWFSVLNCIVYDNWDQHKVCETGNNDKFCIDSLDGCVSGFQVLAVVVTR